MSNSPLTSYMRISPFRNSPRTHAIDCVAIHCVVGQLSVEALGEIFQTKRASANYGIGSDGRIGLYVPEADRSWCTSSAEVDNRAVTIECASDASAPYAINEAVFKSLIKLLADICKRNGIERLKWSTRKEERVGHLNGVNMMAHRDYAAKACPGDYIYNREGMIADAVNGILKQDRGVRYKAYNEKAGWGPATSEGKAGKPKGDDPLQAFRIYPPEGVELTAFASVEGEPWRVYRGIKQGNSKVTIGTTGQGKRLEAFEVRVDKGPEGKALKYRAFAHGSGWTSWTKGGNVCGSVGSARYLEAIQFKYE